MTDNKQQAVSEQAAPQQEPVASAWMQNGVMVNAFPRPPRSEAEEDPDGYWKAKGFYKLPLHFAASYPQAAQPQTSAECPECPECGGSGEVRMQSAFGSDTWICDCRNKRAAQPQEAGQDADFKNFHRLLCERFGCVHDEVDWKRDQISLIERITSQVAPSLPEGLRKIGRLLLTQDNRYTDQPMFIVQQRRRIIGLDTDYCENVIWLCSEDDYSEASEEEAAQLEAAYQETGRAKNGWQRTGYIDQWEFVTACFTEQGCKDYLARDGHNLKEPRIYADGSYRNEEFRFVRDWLMSIAAAPSAPSVSADSPTPTAAGGRA